MILHVQPARPGAWAPPLAVLPGSFDPLHHGHRELAAVAAARLGVPVAFELSVANVDKTDLSDDAVSHRLAQFAGWADVFVTRAKTFAEKAALFPGATFVVGYDTAARLIDPKYYANDVQRRDAALRSLLAANARVLVAGRADATGVFRSWAGGGLDAALEALFAVIPEADFRADVSSSAIRRNGVS